MRIGDFQRVQVRGIGGAVPLLGGEFIDFVFSRMPSEATEPPNGAAGAPCCLGLGVVCHQLGGQCLGCHAQEAFVGGSAPPIPISRVQL